MPLQSELFRDDAALQACLVKDSAHVTPGARGQHVGKIQSALSILEGTLMDVEELKASVYGPSTADAVLEYKVKRDIVNRSYQQRADNIVGKMTIASLDREMAVAEQRKSRKVCREPAHGPAPLKRQSVRDDLVGDAPAPQKFSAICSVIFQLVGIRGKLGPQSLSIVVETLRRANELTKPLGIGIVANAGPSFDIGQPVRVTSEVRLEGIRRSAEKSLSGFTASLRVLVCPFEDEDGKPDLKTNGVSSNAKDENRKPFQRYVVINSLILRKDRGTLLHEMIHCSDEALMGEIGVHDPDGSGGIFSWDADRTKLFPGRAQALRDAFFSLKR